MYICTELFEERPLGLIFGIRGYLWPCSDKFEFLKKFTHLTKLDVIITFLSVKIT